VDASQLIDNFSEMRGNRVHEAIDILAPRGTPVLAVDDGFVEKLFTSAQGGYTIYEFDRVGTYCYYYAHLERYADGLQEGKAVKKGEVIGYVGTSGNAPPGTPHLHFTIFKLGPEKQWWKGTAVNPFPLWVLKKVNNNG
jgi:murein DD-endopeptidase MepM/ murein hydrolase activator NlpD